MKTPLATIAVAMALTAIVSPLHAAARPSVHHPHGVGLGSTIVAGPMRITPTAVVEDSRCPTRVTCVWAGRVVVRVTISSLTAKLTREMTMGEPVSIGGKDVVLVAVTPAKSSRPIKPSDYRFRFTINPGTVPT